MKHRPQYLEEWWQILLICNRYRGARCRQYQLYGFRRASVTNAMLEQSKHVISNSYPYLNKWVLVKWYYTWVFVQCWYRYNCKYHCQYIKGTFPFGLFVIPRVVLFQVLIVPFSSNQNKRTPFKWSSTSHSVVDISTDSIFFESLMKVLDSDENDNSFGCS